MKKLIGVIVFSLLFVQCSTDKHHTIAKNQLGTINKNTSEAELNKLFKKDSIVKLPEEASVFREYKVFDKEGKHLLTIKPEIKRDSIKGIQLVKIFSDHYETEKGISTASTYKDIVENYSISKVEPTFNSAVVFIDEINATIAIDKKDLKLDEFDMRKISKDQIPDLAKVQYITLWFD